MVCSTCGNTLAPDVRFCPRCGTAAAVSAQPQAPSAYTSAGVPMNLAYSRVARHLQITGILWLVYAAEHTFSKLIAILFLRGAFGSHFHHGWGGSWGGSSWGGAWGPWSNFGFAALWPILLASLVFMLALCVLTAYALLTKQPWGRVMAIVASIFALFHPIFGTAIGIYTLWVLAPAASGVEYAAIAESSPRR
jgi:hypothetical protein